MRGKFKANDEVQLKADSHPMTVVDHAITHGLKETFP